MKKSLLAFLGLGSILMMHTPTHAQISFTSATNRFQDPTIYSGCPVTVIDWNNDGLDDIVRLNLGRYAFVEVQRPGQTFQSISFGDMSINQGDDWAWAMAVADVDDNGYKDIIAGGYGPAVKIFKMNATGTAATLVSLPTSNFFLQNLTVLDVDNDGDVDIFCCDDNAESHIYVNDGAGNFTASSIINFNVSATDDSGNYGSAWTDYDNDGDLDLHIAKCRQAITNPADPRRINLIFRNNGNGTFTEAGAAANLNIGWQSWTGTFGDIDNDNDFDVAVCNHDYVSQILTNDGSAVFTDVTTSTGFTTAGLSSGMPIEAAMEDFDNDGFIDIFITGEDHLMWRNNGNSTFSLVNGLFNANGMLTFAVGDANHDGFIDVYAGYGNIYTSSSATPDELWLNDRNANNWITIDPKGTVANTNAVGARVTIYGSWGVQTREVRVGESYGTVNSSLCHFGIGQATAIDSVVVYFPSGNSETVVDPDINQFITVVENDCVSPTATISSPQNFAICGAGTCTLNAATGSGYTYLWSTGATTSSITVSAPGEYQVTITQSGNNCPGVSPTVTVTTSPDETPTIAATGPTTICYGDQVVLDGPAGLAGYSWSDGQTTEDAVVTQSGSYTLTITGSCQNWTSAPISVTVNSATAPSTTGDNIPAPGTGTITATGTSITWYDAATGGNVVGTGSPFTTPFISATTTYYAEDVQTFGGGNDNGGIMYHSGTAFSGNTTNGWLGFDVMQACTLNTVKVYTDTYGSRTIQLKDNGGNVIASQSVNVNTDTMVVTLNFALPVGTGYQLTTDAAVNNTNFGFNSPRLRRNSSAVAMPYSIGSAISINNSSAGTAFYYYFYDWQISYPSTMCPGPRTGATVVVGTGNSVSEISVDGFSIWPNPSSDKVNIKNTDAAATFSVEVVDVTGRKIWSAASLRGNASLDVNTWNAGVYFITINSAKGKTVQRIVVE
ncbi:MAG: FG-GAP-like repeat-containing protein [Bacteroidota bacterium]